jgi:8-oxo-dGTP pyrophosphatase MutT (NUDIX family)
MTRQRGPIEETSAGGVVFRRTDAGVVVLLIKDSYQNWGFPKGHIEPGEDPAGAAAREIAEETGLEGLVLHGALRAIDWYFRFRGRLVHKTCRFFLFESPSGEPHPQAEEGISDCRWLPLDAALRTISYANAREVLEEAGAAVAQLAAS